MSRRVFLQGLAASTIAAALMIAFRVATGSATLPEVLVDVATRVTPFRLFSLAVETLGPWAKRLLVIFLTAALLLVSGLLGIAWAKLRKRRTANRRWSDAGLLALDLWLFSMLVILPASLRGAFGLSATPRPWMTVISWAVSSLAFSFTLAMLSGRESRGTCKPVSMSETESGRRAFIRGLGWTVAGIAVAAGLGAGIWRAVSRLSSKVIASFGSITPEITSNADFYTVSKNFADPTVDSVDWTLEITGLVEKPFSMDYRILLDAPVTIQVHTIECISNPVGGDLISTAEWQGVQLQQLLRQAGVKPTATKVVLHAADGYSDSIAISKALDPGTLIAHRMNGEPLPNGHGFPARLLVPDIYGMKNVKWLTKIELVDYDYKGYWQERGWSDSAQVETMSRIDVPKTSGEFALPDEATLAGVAFAGMRGISWVELSTDGGTTWSRAQLRQPRSQFTWVIWTYDWTPPKEGTYRLLVRAADGTGQVEKSEVSYPLPGGATGYHEVTIKLVRTQQEQYPGQT